MKTTGKENDFVAKMYFTDDIDGGIELDWCLRWKREILGWNDGMVVRWVGGEGMKNHLSSHFETETVFVCIH